MSQFIWGCVGAIAPEVVRWYRITRVGPVDEWKRGSYWIATTAYVALGGIFATLVAQPNPWASFVAGATTEFGVMGVLTAATERREGGGPAEELYARDLNRRQLAVLYLQRHAAYLGYKR